MRKKRESLLLRHALQSFALIVLLGLGLRLFVVTSFVMAGLSMLPTIFPGDFLFGTRFGLAHLRRGDVVALRCPQDKDQICLKRVIGLPGDRIEFRAGFLTINEQTAVLNPIAENIVSESVDGETWMIWPEKAEETPQGDPAPVVVPPGEVYLLNDKRSAPEDSRQWGTVQMDLIEAKVRRVWLSLDWYRDGQVRTWPALRLERMFRSIH